MTSTSKPTSFDVEVMQLLAKDLAVKIELVPYTLGHVPAALNTGQFDMAISGLQMSTKRMQLVSFTKPVLKLHYALVIRDHQLDEFATNELIKKAGEIRVALVGDYPIVEHMEKKFPNVRFLQIRSDREFFDNQGKDYDALLTSLEAGKTWTLLYPEYTTTHRRGVESFPASYAVALDNVNLLNFMNSWLEVQQSSGKIDKLFDYWIQGKNAIPKQPRWSILKDVLHWTAQPEE